MIHPFCDSSNRSFFHILEVNSSLLTRDLLTSDTERQPTHTHTHRHTLRKRLMGDNMCVSVFLCLCVGYLTGPLPIAAPLLEGPEAQ